MMCSKFIQSLDKILNQKIEAYEDINFFLEKNKKYISKECYLKSLSKVSIIVILDDEILVKSNAVAFLLDISSSKTLRYISKIIEYFKISIMDFIYDLISSRRGLISIFFKKKCNICFNNINIIQKKSLNL